MYIISEVKIQDFLDLRNRARFRNGPIQNDFLIIRDLHKLAKSPFALPGSDEIASEWIEVFLSRIQRAPRIVYTVVEVWYPLNLTHILQDYFTAIGAIIR